MSAAYCATCRTGVRVKGSRYVEHYVNGSRCDGSGMPVGGPPPDLCAHSGKRRRDEESERMRCGDCGDLLGRPS